MNLIKIGLPATLMLAVIIPACLTLCVHTSVATLRLAPIILCFIVVVHVYVPWLSSNLRFHHRKPLSNEIAFNVESMCAF